MRSTLAAAVVIACLLMGYTQAASPAPQPEQGAPQTTQPEPTGAPQETPAPPAEQPSAAPKQETTPETAPQSAPETKQAEAPKPEGSQPTPSQKSATTAKKKTRRHKAKPVVDPSSTTPSKTVVRNGGTSEPEVQLAPRLSKKQQADQKQKIANLLLDTDANLQKVAGRQLKTSEEEMVKQIHVYMEQAKQASEAGDLQRAQNLASKANLLSVELVGK